MQAVGAVHAVAHQSRVPRAMTGRRLPRPYEPGELRRLQAVARPEVWAVCVFLRETGLRSAEACSITIHEAKSWPQPPRWCRRPGCARHSAMSRIIGKGDKERAVMLSPAALRASRVLASHAHNGRLIGWSDRGLRYVIAEAGKAAGVHAYCHRFRHTHISELVEAGVPVEVVSEMAGHSRTDTTRLYWSASHRLRARAMQRRGRFLRRAD